MLIQNRISIEGAAMKQVFRFYVSCLLHLDNTSIHREKKNEEYEEKQELELNQHNNRVHITKVRSEIKWSREKKNDGIGIASKCNII